MKKLLSLPLLLVISIGVLAQETPENPSDTIPSLGEVVIKGFESNREQLSIPASVSVLRSRDLQRFGNVSLVPVLNTVPGVRMEERSPSSYRLSIRGSLLRSPFGVRNVKVYWNDLPLTDAGGNTYVNLLDFNGVGSVELIKGPAGSIYGAGTGGVMVVNTPTIRDLPETLKRSQDFTFQLTGGSYGLFTEYFRWQSATKNAKWQFIQGHSQADGYRENSRSRREVIQGSVSAFTSKRNRIDGVLLLADLYYRTPGGLTLAQMQNNPKQARPATPATPGAVEQKAAIYNRTAYGGITNTFTFNDKWTNVTSIVASVTDFKNPFITNYEQRDESSIGLRSKFVFSSKLGQMPLRWITGLEWQSTYSTIDSSGNDGGEPDDNHVKDKANANQQFYFTQAELELTGAIMIQAGVSLNYFSYTLQRIEPAGPKNPLDFNAQLMPRFALLYKITNTIAAHASASKGFSPPSLAEVRPSAGGFYTNLQAEHGWNYELGVRGSVMRNRIQFDISAFQFDLTDAIVRRTDTNGSEFFVNAGGTSQKGLEAFAEWYAVQKPTSKGIQQLRLWSSATLFDFVFEDYSVGSNEYSGNELTGVPRKVFLVGFDLQFLGNFYLNTTFNYTSKLPLNDANDAYATDYRLLQGRAGWKKPLRSKVLEIFAGIDNALDQTYSLGNDINAFRGRYYNPAPLRNYYAGVKFVF
jgi:iron complex outermembrane receptor protein